jgi:hypothetical protein
MKLSPKRKLALAEILYDYVHIVGKDPKTGSAPAGANL